MKKSVRDVWSSKDFMEYTGMFKINKYTGEKERCSEGTISYYNKEFELTEKALYDYHSKITKKIQNISFDDWSRKNNKGYHKKETITNTMIKQRALKYFNLDRRYEKLSPSKILTLIERTFGQDELVKFFKCSVQGGDA